MHLRESMCMFSLGNGQPDSWLCDRARHNPTLTLSLIPGMQRRSNLLLLHKLTHLASYLIHTSEIRPQSLHIREAF